MTVRVNLPLSQLTRAGIAPAAEVAGDASNGHSVQNDGDVFVLVRNSNGSSTAHAVTIHVPELVDGQAVASRTVSVPATVSRYLGRFPASTYGSLVLIDVDNAELKLSAYHL